MALIEGLALAIGVVWGALFLFRGGIFFALGSVLLAGVCFGSHFYRLDLGAAPLTLDRLGWCGLIGVCLVWRRFGWAELKLWTRMDLMVMAFMAWLTFSTICFGPGLEKNPPHTVFVFFYFLPLGMYFVARNASTNPRSLRTCFAVLAIFGMYLGATAYCETHEKWSLVFPRYMAERTGDFEEFFGRGRGPLINPIGNGMMLILSLSATLLLIPRTSPIARVVLLLPTGLALVGCYYTMTRSVWMGAGAALAVLFWVPASSSWRRWFLVCGVLGTFIAAPLVWDKLIAFKRDKNLSEAETADSVYLRPILASMAWSAFQDRPIVGTGLGRYKLYNHPYAYDHSNPLPLEKGKPYVQHNVFLSLLVETGAIGLMLYLGMMIYWACAARAIWRCSSASLEERQWGLLTLAFLAAFFVNGMFHEMSLIPMVNSFLFSLTGVLSGLAAKYGLMQTFTLNKAFYYRPKLGGLLPQSTRSASV